MQYRSVIRLTETRDIQSVNTTFLDILNSVIHGRFVLYVLQGIGRENRFVLSSEVNPFGPDAESILALFNPKAETRPSLPKDLRPFPLASVNGLHAVLIVDRKAQIQDEVFLNFIITVYCNQFNLVEACSYDALTGLMNRGEFDKKLYQLLDNHGQSNRRNEAVNSCLALLDVDHFKQINDRFGHLYGDEVLLLLGQQLPKVFREDDWLFRYGGEEFAIILRGVTEDQCEAILERARSAIEAYCFPQVGKVTVSIGYTYVDQIETSSGLISQADAALYYAKSNGRNQVQRYQALIDQGALEKGSEVVGDIDLF
ncbi:GGDEF domain-containing protein [Litoribrevibacter albus]|uniref:GGDEF domain-containing protein n=1 Tax=Litoribrevibacter albus TaxID=1473156 RepID=UPI0024E13256|nr:GGDEF domain-containing protein [Litoribrevibacter albus]